MFKYILSLLLVINGFSSLKSQVDCSKQLEVVKSQLETRKIIHESILAEMSKSLDTCLSSNGISYYIRGLIELRKGNSEGLKKSIQNFEAASEMGFTRAKTYLGYSYKNGWGVTKDPQQSLYWIRQAAEEGDDNAIYTLGYYYLKGIGGVQPDYKQALTFFQRSNHKMAKYWLAFCKNFGLGSSADKVDAMRILEKIETPEGQLFVEYLDSNIGQEIISIEKSNNLIPENISLNNTYGGFQGLWIEKDWMDKLILRKLPLSIEMESHNNGDLNLSMTIEKHKYPLLLNNKGKLKKEIEIGLSAPFRGPDHPETITYLIKEITTYKDTENEAIELRLTTWIREYDEPGPPISIQIYGPKALDNRIDKSFYVFPNAFSQFLKYSFTIEFPSKVNLEIFDLTGKKVKSLDFMTLEPGPQLLEVNCHDLKPQNYVAVLNINGSKFTRQVIKK